MKNIKKKRITIYDCINQYQTKKNIAELQKCPKCKSNVISLQQKIYRPANYMIFVFNNDLNQFSTFENLKILQLKDYINDKNYIQTSYLLIGACIHKGFYNNNGHYFSVCLNNNNEYYSFNDSYSLQVSFDYIKNIFPYILFYKKLNENQKNLTLSIPIDDQNKKYIDLILNELKNLFLNQIFFNNTLTIEENLLIFNTTNNKFKLIFKIGSDNKLELIFNKCDKISTNRSNASNNYNAKLILEYQLTGVLDKDLKNIKDIIKEQKSQLYSLSNYNIKINIK